MPLFKKSTIPVHRVYHGYLYTYPNVVEHILRIVLDVVFNKILKQIHNIGRMNICHGLITETEIKFLITMQNEMSTQF